MSEKATPRVSIGLPVYNGENFVGQAIESLLAQTFEDFELIISDNASTDTTEEIFRAFAARGFGQMITRSYRKYLESTWNTRLHRFAKDVASVIPSKDIFILLDEGKLPTHVLGDRRTTSFSNEMGSIGEPPPR